MEETLFRIIIVGDTSVGKTCILCKFTDGIFKDAHEATIGVELGIKIIFLQEEQIKFQIWDTSGQENYRSVTRSFYRRADCALLVFDLTISDTFQNCIHWLSEIRGNTKTEIQVFLIGNKSDLLEGPEAEEIHNAAKEFAERNKLAGYFQTSAKTGENIEMIFENLARKLKEVKENVGPTDSGKFEIQVVSSSTIQPRKKCCLRS